MKTAISAPRHVGLLLCTLGTILGAYGCADQPISLREMWARSEVKQPGWRRESPEAVLPGTGLLTQARRVNEKGFVDTDERMTTFRLRSMATGEILSEFTQSGPWKYLGFDSTGRYLATPVSLWDVAKGEKIADLAKPEEHFSEDLAVSPDGRAVLSAGNHRDILLYRIESGDRPLTVQPSVIGQVPGYKVKKPAFSPDGTRAVVPDLATSSWLLWDTKDWKLISRVKFQETPAPEAIDAPWVGFVTPSLLVDWDTGRLICRIKQPGPGFIRKVALLPDRSGILAYCKGDRIDFYRDHSLCLFDLSGRLVAKRPLSSWLYPLALSQDGQYMVTRNLIPVSPAWFLPKMDRGATGPIRLWRINIIWPEDVAQRKPSAGHDRDQRQ